MSRIHTVLEETDTQSNGDNYSADQGAQPYHEGAVFVLDMTNSPTTAWSATIDLQVKATPTGTTYADWTATPELFSVSESDAATVQMFTVAPSASADLNAYMPGLWRVHVDVTVSDDDEVQTLDLGDIGTADTFKIQTGGTGTKTTAITYSTVGTGTAMATAMQAAIRLITGYEAVTVAKTSNTVFVFTFPSTMGDVTLLKVTDTATFDPKTDAGYTLGFIETTPGVAEPFFALTAQMLS